MNSLLRLFVLLFSYFAMFMVYQQNCCGDMTVAPDRNTTDNKYMSFNFIVPNNNVTDDERQRLIFALKIHEIMTINTDIRIVICECANEFKRIRDDLKNHEPSMEFKLSENKNPVIINSIVFKLGDNDLLSFTKSDKNFIIIFPDKKDEIIHFIFHPEGYLASVIHFNLKLEQIGHYAEWNHEGKLIREGNHTKPVTLKLLKEK